VYHDEALGVKELWANSHKMEAWRKTRSYAYCVAVSHQTRSPSPFLLYRIDRDWLTFAFFLCCGGIQDFNKAQSSNPIKGFDVLHQLYRLRYAKKMADTETITIMRVLAENTKSYEQCVEVNFASFFCTLCSGVDNSLLSLFCFGVVSCYHT
jgi:hypothetical protein